MRSARFISEKRGITDYDKICYKDKNSFKSYKKSRRPPKARSVDQATLLQNLGIDENDNLPVERRILLGEEEIPRS